MEFSLRYDASETEEEEYEGEAGPPSKCMIIFVFLCSSPTYCPDEALPTAAPGENNLLVKEYFFV